MENELSPEEATNRGWSEVGTVTGRQRRAAEFDFDLARRAILLNGATQIAITKLDVLFPSCKGARTLEAIDDKAKSFIKNIEDTLGIPVTLLGTGPTIDDIVDLRTKN